MEQRFQFSLRNLLLAMSWLSLWAALGTARSYLGAPPQSEVLGILLWVVLCTLFVGLPVVAVCALFGRTERGLRIIAVIAAVLLVLALILRAFTDFP
jgi:hypothetical protein